MNFYGQNVCVCVCLDSELGTFWIEMKYILWSFYLFSLFVRSFVHPQSSPNNRIHALGEWSNLIHWMLNRIPTITKTKKPFGYKSQFIYRLKTKPHPHGKWIINNYYNKWRINVKWPLVQLYSINSSLRWL